MRHFTQFSVLYTIHYQISGDDLVTLEGNRFNKQINKSITNLFKNALQHSLKSPSQAWFFLSMIRKQKKAAKKRIENEKRGLHVPPFMIASITHNCNLKCKGCYAQAQHRKQELEMDKDRLKSVVGEARDLGVSIILLAGGEPLVRRDEIFEIARGFNEIIFPLFTNGTLLNENTMDRIKTLKNIVPVVSIEGYQEETDQRRGTGVYETLKNVFQRMNKKGVFYGTSITLTQANFETVTEEGFLKDLVYSGCKLFFFVDYVPVKEGTEDWVLTEGQRSSLLERIDRLRSQLPGLFIAFPGDEEAFGGCLAAGRGFIHISPEGNVEPCPFAPFSDTNLKGKSLIEALDSSFLKEIRDNHALLVEGQGGCALWENRELVKSLIHK